MTTPSDSRGRERRTQPGYPLSARELQVLELVAAGAQTPAVASSLGIAESTVKRHLTNVYRKTGTLNRVQATRYYIEHYH
jgi:DNA-binding CsgD family transcriptional regulator